MESSLRAGDAIQPGELVPRGGWFNGRHAFTVIGTGNAPRYGLGDLVVCGPVLRRGQAGHLVGCDLVAELAGGRVELGCLAPGAVALDRLDGRRVELEAGAVLRLVEGRSPANAPLRLHPGSEAASIAGNL